LNNLSVRLVNKTTFVHQEILVLLDIISAYFCLVLLNFFTCGGDFFKLDMLRGFILIHFLVILFIRFLVRRRTILWIRNLLQILLILWIFILACFFLFWFGIFSVVHAKFLCIIEIFLLIIVFDIFEGVFHFDTIAKGEFFL